MHLDALITAAWERRDELHRNEDLDVHRVFHGFADGLPGVNIDLYHNTLLVNYEIELADNFGAIRDLYLSLKPDLSVIAKAHHKLNLPLRRRFELLCGERGKQFDGVILDPPPLLPKRNGLKGSVGAQNFTQLMRYCGELISPGGWLLCLFHEFGKSRSSLESSVVASTDTPLQLEYQSTWGIDFNERDDHNKLRISVFRRPVSPGA